MLPENRYCSGEKKYYLADLNFFFARNTDNRINYGPDLENIIFNYAESRNYAVSIGKIGKLKCDFILRDNQMNYAYVQISYTILASRETEDREYRPLEMIPDNCPVRFCSMPFHKFTINNRSFLFRNEVKFRMFFEKVF